jgi:sensor histidine kinase YesM
VTNTIEYSSTRDPVGGIGLKNVKRRLELLYDGKHKLEINEGGELFKVDLKISV